MPVVVQPLRHTRRPFLQAVAAAVATGVAAPAVGTAEQQSQISKRSTVLAAALAYERARGPRARRPPLATH